MNKNTFYTVTIEEQCFDLPKEMSIPRKGENIYIGGKSGVVEEVNYHINDDGTYTISLFTRKK